MQYNATASASTPTAITTAPVYAAFLKGLNLSASIEPAAINIALNPITRP